MWGSPFFKIIHSIVSLSIVPTTRELLCNGKLSIERHRSCKGKRDLVNLVPSPGPL